MGSCTLLVQDFNPSDLVLILVLLVPSTDLIPHLSAFSHHFWLLHLHQGPYPYPQAGVTFFQKSYVAPSKAAQAPLLQIKTHQCEDLNHLTGKVKPHQTLVRDGSCLGEVSLWQRQHSSGCYVWCCPLHRHPEFWCFSPNPCCSTLGPAVKVRFFAILLLTISISKSPCLHKRASNLEPSPLRENNLNYFFFFLASLPLTSLLLWFI